MDIITDIFSQDAFRNISLTAMVNEVVPYAPGFLSQLGLFTGDGMVTTDVALEELGGALRLISATPRGAPPSEQTHQKGAIRKLPSQHLAREATLNADELLALRAYGSLNAQTALNLLNRRIEGPVGLKVELAFTKEHMYLGAIDGTVYDGDNATVLYDYFGFYGITRPASMAIPLSTTTDKTGLIRVFAQQLRRAMVQALNGMALGEAKPVAICGDQFFDTLTGSQELVAAVRTGAFGNSDAADVLGLDLAYANVQYAGISWVNYRGDAAGAVSVPTAEARAFMTGVPGLFQEFWAPADTFETVSAIGLPFYLLQRIEKQTSSRRVFELQANPALICLRPLHMRRITLA